MRLERQVNDEVTRILDESRRMPASRQQPEEGPSPEGVDRANFDEDDYLRRNPDVAEAIRRGHTGRVPALRSVWISGRSHINRTTMRTARSSDCAGLECQPTAGIKQLSVRAGSGNHKPAGRRDGDRVGE